MGSIAVPSSLTGGSPASFATSASDNLDLVSYDYILNYPISPPGNPIAAVPILTPSSAATTFHAAFSGTLLTASSFNLSVPSFIRTLNVTDPTGIPANSTG